MNIYALLIRKTVNLLFIAFKEEIPIRERTIQKQTNFWQKLWQGIRNVPYRLACAYNKCRSWIRLILLGGAFTVILNSSKILKLNKN